MTLPLMEDKKRKCCESKAKGVKGGYSNAPVREVPSHDTSVETKHTNMDNQVPKELNTTPVCVVSEETSEADEDHMAEIPMESLTSNNNIFTRTMEPFKPIRIKEIQHLVTIGDDLTDQEHAQVRALIAEFADTFALSVSEIKQVDGAIHWLNIEPDAKFSTKVHQKPLTPPQCWYLHE